MSKDNMTCAAIKVDGLSLKWVDGVLTTSDNPVNVIQAPCGSFKLDVDVFAVKRHSVITSADKQGEVKDSFTLCGGVELDSEVFMLAPNGIVCMIPTSEPEPVPEVTVKFLPGEHGTFNGRVTDTYTLHPKDSYPAAPIADNINVTEGWEFTGWSPEYTLSGTVADDATTETLTFTAQYQATDDGE